MTVLLIAGSPTRHSRSAALLQTVGTRLKFRGAQVQSLSVRDLPAQALLLADFNHPAMTQVQAQVARARVIVIATPVYKAAYSGVLKVLLDILPQSAFKGKTILPLATGGSPHHMLALDYALRPVLQSLGAHHILPGVYATDAQVTLTPEGGTLLDPDIEHRLRESVDLLVEAPLRAGFSNAGRFSPVHFTQVRYSV